MLNGIDIASYQGELNLDNITYDFVCIKATEGTSYVNPYCDEHYQEAKAAGKKLAVYHFAGYGNAEDEANYFVDNCEGYIGEAIFVLDWEGSFVGDVGWAQDFLSCVKDRIGSVPAIYMSESVENAYDWSPVVAADHGLWLAKYSDYEIDNNYDMTNAGQSPNCVHWPFYFMWQWTSKGHLTGYAGDLDCDIAYLDAAGWDRYSGAHEVPLPEPTPTPETHPTPATPDPTPSATPSPGAVITPTPQVPDTSDHSIDGIKPPVPNTSPKHTIVDEAGNIEKVVTDLGQFKTGYKTTEFWTTLGVDATTLAGGFLPGNTQAVKIVSAVVALIVTVVYVWSRVAAKKLAAS